MYKFTNRSISITTKSVNRTINISFRCNSSVTQPSTITPGALEVLTSKKFISELVADVDRSIDYMEKRKLRSRSFRKTYSLDNDPIDLEIRSEKRVKELKRLLNGKVIDLEDLWSAYEDVKFLSEESLGKISNRLYEKIILAFSKAKNEKNLIRIKFLVEDKLAVKHGLEIKELYTYLKTCNSLKLSHDTISLVRNWVTMGKNLDTFIINHTLSAFCQLGDLISSIEAFESIQENNFKYDQYSYSYLIEIYLKKGYIKDAHESYQLFMNDSNVLKDTWSFNIMLTKFVFHNDWEGAKLVFIDLLKINPKTDITTLSILLKGALTNISNIRTKNYYYLQQNTPIQTIKAIYQGLRKAEVPLDKVAYSTFLHTFASAGNIFYSERIMNHMTNAGHKPDLWEYSILINLYCKQKQWKKALSCYQLVKSKELGITRPIYGAILKAYTNLKPRDFNVSDISIVNLEPRDLISFNVMIRHLSKNEKIEESYRLFQTMIKGGINPDIFTYSAFFEGICNIGPSLDQSESQMVFRKDLLQMAEQVYNHLQNNPIDINLPVFNSIINSFSYLRSWDSVQSIYTSMTQTYNLVPNNRTFFPIVRLILEDVSIESALNLILNPTSSGHSKVMYSSIIHGFVQARELPKALALYHHIKKLESDPHFSLVADGEHNYDIPKPDIHTYCTLIQGCLRMYDSYTAQNLIADMHHQRLSAPIHIYQQVIDQLVQDKQPGKAKEFKENLESLDLETFIESDEEKDSSIEWKGQASRYNDIKVLLIQCYYRLVGQE